MKKLNFIFILIDDLGWKDLSIYGSEFYETPNIDRLAEEGVIFTNAYSASPVYLEFDKNIGAGTKIPKKNE
jgi:arylsulfatase A-like enzyme